MRVAPRVVLGACLFGAATCPVGDASAQGSVRAGGDIIIHEGMCEPSAAVAAAGAGGRELLIVADDGDNILRAYDAERGGAPERVLDLNDHLGIPPEARGTGKGRADIEAAARLGDLVFWIASHSRENNRGELRPNRHMFFATTVEAADGAGGAGPVVRSAGAARSLFDALAEERLGLRAALGVDRRGGPRERDFDARAEGKGLNIEGLARGREDGTLLIGLRNPLRGGKAILIPFANPREVVERDDARPVLGTPIALDLGGRGVRSIAYAERAPPERRYLIVAGPPGGGDDFALYAWSGDPARRPVELPGAAAAFRAFAVVPDGRGARFRFGPEALVTDPEGTTIRLLSDDGDRPTAADGATTICQDAARAEDRSFRGAVLRLHGTPPTPSPRR